MFPNLTAGQILPADGYAGTLIGRALFPGVYPGPCVVVVREDGVYNISGTVPTVAQLLNMPNPLSVIKKALGNCVYLGPLDDILKNSTPDKHDPLKPYLLSPIDLQAVKATGMTFVKGMLREAVEHAGGEDMVRALEAAAGQPLEKILPGTPAVEPVRAQLMEKGQWTGALEVAFGPDAELFTKAQPLSAIGTGAEIGMHPDSDRTFAEPEVVLVINAEGKIQGATLGADMTLRDMHARSHLLLSRTKEHNSTCAVGPFIRLFDQSFSLPNVQGMKVTYAIEGEDGAVTTDTGSMEQLSRGLLSLVKQTVNPSHGYPDGVALFTGCMFRPPETRGAGDTPFTHKVGDIVTIKSGALGALTNRVQTTDKVKPWNFGIADLMDNLAHRHLIG